MDSCESCGSVLPVLSTVAGSGYIAISNLRLEFGPARDFHLVNVSIINDDIIPMVQQSFSAMLSLDSPLLSTINISTSQAEVIIEDDDGMSSFFMYMFHCRLVLQFC